MREAEENKVDWDDVDEGTFIRFMEFMYTGDYAAAEPDILLSHSDVGDEDLHARDDSPAEPPDTKTMDMEPVAEPPAEHEAALSDTTEPLIEEPKQVPYDGDIWGAWSSKKKQTKKNKAEKVDCWADDRKDNPFVYLPKPKKSKGEMLWESFQIDASVRQPEPWQPHVNEDTCEHFTPVFLCHAKLYRLADKYTIQPLADLVIYKLRLTLSRFILHPQRIGDVIELLEYTYENTMEYNEKIDRLRNLVSEYVICHIEKIVKHSDFLRMLQKEGDMAKDVMLKLMRRLD